MRTKIYIQRPEKHNIKHGCVCVGIHLETEASLVITPDVPQAFIMVIRGILVPASTDLRYLN